MIDEPVFPPSTATGGAFVVYGWNNGVKGSPQLLVQGPQWWCQFCLRLFHFIHPITACTVICPIGWKGEGLNDLRKALNAIKPGKKSKP